MHFFFFYRKERKKGDLTTKNHVGWKRHHWSWKYYFFSSFLSRFTHAIDLFLFSFSPSKSFSFITCFSPVIYADRSSGSLPFILLTWFFSSASLSSDQPAERLTLVMTSFPPVFMREYFPRNARWHHLRCVLIDLLHTTPQLRHLVYKQRTLGFATCTILHFKFEWMENMNLEFT